jgi:NitT/TauT family transport system substrate-binding protein
MSELPITLAVPGEFKESILSRIPVVKTIYLLLIALVINFSACSRDDQEVPAGSFDKISLGVPSSDYPLFLALVLLAREQGFFKEYGLDMTYQPYPHGVGSLKALQNGDVDLAIGAEFPFVKQNLSGSRMMIIASIAQVDVLELIARKDKGILHPADLKGKRVALILESQLEFCLDRFLLQYGLTLKDIEKLNLLPPGIEQSILEGTADAMVFREPMSGRVKAALKNNWVSWPVQNRQHVFWVIAGGEDYVSRHSRAIERFLQALAKAEQFYVNNGRRAIDIIIDKGNLDENFFRGMLPKIEYRLSLENELLIAMEDQARWHIENRYTAAVEVPNYLDRIYFKGLDSVKPASVNIIH